MPPKNFRRKITATDGTPSLAEQLSYLHFPRPFKNPGYTKNINRRAKNLKNVLGQERERERTEREKRQLETGGSTIVVDPEDEIPTYLSIEAPPSVIPQRHYCDITRLHAPYTDPTTGLRYYDKDVYALIKGLASLVFTTRLPMFNYSSRAQALRKNTSLVCTPPASNLFLIVILPCLSVRGVNSVVK
ncbi:hypothetical protein BDP27DRAFT_1289102 [Rhodocollybia butyracea]|uniref:Vps72/YL1 C-terminal domain-containing protein n=1 Tax=Rhodocollybia butyracea TaxID=206335 RepID=A0A9P5UC03_9AGAR|nr:hypothetical protein BDP27DRAFT_1289102 [Rhodocollybia butyracea]